MNLKILIAALHAALLTIPLASSPAGSGSIALMGVGKPAAGGGFDAATDAWETAVISAGGTVGGTRKTVVNTFIVCLKSASLWTTLDRYWLFAGESQIQSTVDMTAAHEVVTLVSSPTWGTSTGFTAGSSAYVRTAVVPSAGGLNFVLNSATVGGQVQNNRTVSGTGNIFGSANGAFNAITSLIPFFASDINYRVNQNAAAGAGVSITTSRGSWAITRTASNAIAAYLNGSSVGTGSTASASLPDGNFLVLGISQGGNTPAAFAETGDQSTSFFIGSGWNATQAGNFETCQNAMMTSIGINVH